MLKEARGVWAKFKELSEGKPLRECTEDDALKLADYLFTTGNASATVRKKIGYLCSALGPPVRRREIPYNIFSGVVGDRQDAKRRVPLTDTDMATVRRNLNSLKPEERLLWMLCATTGMRRGEALSIDHEYEEEGVRFVIIGTKTKSSLRRVPLPDAVLPLLPKKITGPIFTASTPEEQKNLGRNLLRAIRRMGVKSVLSTQLKDLHSLRHRAKDRLRRAECPGEMQDWILGHDEITVSVDYGLGPVMPNVKRWIDKIGY